jgi:AraC-like DNA-binding protein
VFEIYYPSVSLRMGLAAPLLGTAAVYLYGYYTLTHPQIFTEIDIGQAKMDKDSTEQELKHRLLEKMEKAHLWRRENLTLHSLSELTDIPAYKLSRIINSELESNFFTFVNRYRVEEVQKRLKEKKSPTILDAAFQSGFNSKSTFNDAFKRITGITPSQYKKKVRIQRIQ